MIFFHCTRCKNKLNIHEFHCPNIERRNTSDYHPGKWLMRIYVLLQCKDQWLNGYGHRCKSLETITRNDHLKRSSTCFPPGRVRNLLELLFHSFSNQEARHELVNVFSFVVLDVKANSTATNSTACTFERRNTSDYYPKKWLIRINVHLRCKDRWLNGYGHRCESLETITWNDRLKWSGICFPRRWVRNLLELVFYSLSNLGPRRELANKVCLF